MFFHEVFHLSTGAKECEVAVMNGLTVNLHLMMVRKQVTFDELCMSAHSGHIREGRTNS